MITIGRCGYESRHRTVFEMLRPDGSPDYTLLFVKSEAYFEIEGHLLETPANTAVLFPPFTYVHYGCRTANYNDDWIHFTLPEEDQPFLQSLNLPAGVPLPLACPGRLSELARLIVLEKLSAQPYREQILDHLMRTMLCSLAGQLLQKPDKKTAHKHYELMNRLRMNILNTPHHKWTVGEMSRAVHMSPSYFQHLYRELFGASCMQEVIRARLNNARFYLRTTDMSIQSLAGFCGYENELHFMRQFKKNVGMTPSEYRERSRLL